VTRAAPRAVLWDMDGTLVDSGDLHFDAWRETMRVLGRDLTRPEFDATFGQRNDTILRRLVDPAISDAEIDRIGDEKEARYRALVAAQGIRPLAGALDWLRALAGAGWRQAIASSGPRANTEAIIEALGLHGAFAAIVAAEDVTHGKPHPEVFLTAAARLGVAPARCVVVGDIGADMEAARAAGARGILVPTPLTREEEVAAADAVAPDLAAAVDRILGEEVHR